MTSNAENKTKCFRNVCLAAKPGIHSTYYEFAEFSMLLLRLESGSQFRTLIDTLNGKSIKQQRWLRCLRSLLLLLMLFEYHHVFVLSTWDIFPNNRLPAERAAFPCHRRRPAQPTAQLRPRLTFNPEKPAPARRHRTLHLPMPRTRKRF